MSAATTRPGGGTRGWLAAMFVLGVALAYAVALPAISQSMSEDDEVAAGLPYPIEDGLAVTPSEGWRRRIESGPLVALAKGAAVVRILAVPAPNRPTGDAIDAAIAELEADPGSDWIVGEPHAFTTDQGVQGLTFDAHSIATVRQIWMIANKRFTTTILGDAPQNVWTTVSDEMGRMARSVAFVEEDGS